MFVMSYVWKGVAQFATCMIIVIIDLRIENNTRKQCKVNSHITSTDYAVCNTAVQKFEISKNIV